MSSWIRETENKSWMRQFCCNVLKTGPIPRHVAFIMDGNRRFAKKNSMDRAQGHLMGFDKLAETLEWCLDLGIAEVTVYAFSIENFKRSKDEVNGLMELARQKFAKLLEEKEMIEKHGVCIRVLGNLSLLPQDVLEVIAEAVSLTQHNNRAILNVCFAYTSRDEMCCAMREAVEGVQLGFIRESDIDEHLLEKCLYTSQSPNPELLVRTSGEVRLSDFLLWQSTYSVLSFMKILWPEFSIWHLYAGVLYYQRNYNAVQAAKEDNQMEQERLTNQQDHQCVLEEIQREKEQGIYSDCLSLQQRMHKYRQDREQRVSNFLQNVQAKRRDFFADYLRTSKPPQTALYTTTV